MLIPRLASQSETKLRSYDFAFAPILAEVHKAELKLPSMSWNPTSVR